MKCEKQIKMAFGSDAVLSKKESKICFKTKESEEMDKNNGADTSVSLDPS